MKKNHHSRDRRFGRSVLPQLTVWPLLLLSLMGWLTAADKDSAKETAEMFHVSYVGRGGAAETRELLGAVYTEVAAEYNERIEQEAAETNQGQRYKGERVRILRKIKEKHAEGNLYLCAYAGTPSVFVVPGEPLKSGDLSPPLAPPTVHLRGSDGGNRGPSGCEPTQVRPGPPGPVRPRAAR